MSFPSRARFAFIPSQEYKVVRDIKWSGYFSEGALCENSQSLWHTHETQGPSTSITLSQIPQLLTAFPLRLSNTNPQKCDFCKSYFWQEYKVVHSFCNVKMWQSSTPQFFKLVIFFIYRSSIGVDWKSNQENILRRLAEAKFRRKKLKIG